MMSEFIHNVSGIEISKVKKADDIIYRVITIKTHRDKKEIHLMSNSTDKLLLNSE